jgi:hypothetical protein
MAWFAFHLWRAIISLFVAFIVLGLFSQVLWPLPELMVLAPAAAALALWAVAMVFEGALWAIHMLGALRQSLPALCLGVSLKPFDWRLGDESHLRRPGGRLVALGPFRLAWRLSPIPMTRAEPVTGKAAGIIPFAPFDEIGCGGIR